MRPDGGEGPYSGCTQWARNLSRWLVGELCGGPGPAPPARRTRPRPSRCSDLRLEEEENSLCMTCRARSLVREAFPKVTTVQPNGLSTIPQHLFQSSFHKSHSSQQLLQKSQLNQTCLNTSLPPSLSVDASSGDVLRIACSLFVSLVYCG
jgi:hypothetical protein